MLISNIINNTHCTYFHPRNRHSHSHYYITKSHWYKCHYYKGTIHLPYKIYRYHNHLRHWHLYNRTLHYISVLGECRFQFCSKIRLTGIFEYNHVVHQNRLRSPYRHRKSKFRLCTVHPHIWTGHRCKFQKCNLEQHFRLRRLCNLLGHRIPML